MRSLVSPVFVLSSIRSGSTLLRCLLGSHSQIHAPHELHFRYLRTSSASEYLDFSLEELGLDLEQLRFLLWDRLYHLLLVESGKRILVDKSPSNLAEWKELDRVWPGASFIFLRRDPAAIVRSIVDAKDGRSEGDAVDLVCGAVDKMIEAEKSLHRQHTLTYESLTTTPADVISETCEFLGIPFESAMMDYGKHAHGGFLYGLGDWTEKIKTGVVHSANRERVSTAKWPRLSRACELWGYPT